MATWVQHIGPAIVGFFIGVTWLIWTGGALPIYTPVLVAIGVWGLTQLAIRAGGGLAGQYFAPRGSSTPRPREYSAAQALAAQGRFRDAVTAYEIGAAESNGDPEPYLAIARLLRDHLSEPELAAAWFRRARRDARLSPGQEVLVAQELVDLYTKTLGDPRRAIPELARIPRLVPGSPQAEAAGRQLADLRDRLASEADGATGL